MNNVNSILQTLLVAYGDSFSGTEAKKEIEKSLCFEMLYEHRPESQSLDELHTLLEIKGGGRIAEDFVLFVHGQAQLLKNADSLARRGGKNVDPNLEKELSRIENSRIWQERISRRPGLQFPVDGGKSTTDPVTPKVVMSPNQQLAEKLFMLQYTPKKADTRDIRLTVGWIFQQINQDLTRELVRRVVWMERLK